MHQSQSCENPAGLQPALPAWLVHACYLQDHMVSLCQQLRMSALTYVFSWRTKLLKLLCLKNFGSKSRANSAGFHTTKL